MILAWLLHRRTRQATRPNSFSRRKPVAVRTAPAAPPPSQKRQVAGPSVPLSLRMDGAGPGSLRSARPAPNGAL